MKILNVIDLMNPIFGGSVERSFQMNHHLGMAGIKVDTLTTKWCLDTEWISRLKSGDIYYVNAFFFRYLFPYGARKWLDDNISNYDVVHISKNWSILAYLAARAAKKHDIPYVFSAMGFVSIHNRSRFLKSLYSRFITLPMITNAKACVSVTKEERDDLLNVGAKNEKVHVIPNGIIPEDFLIKDDDSFRKIYSLNNRKIILFIGRMDPIKGVHLLIDAFNRKQDMHSDWCLVLVGTKTSYRNKMEHKVSVLNLNDSVIFIDPIFGKEKSIAYNAAEFIVIPSIKDAMTIIAPEAACCSKPVLFTTTTDFSELSECGGGLEVEPTVDGIKGGLDLLMGNEINLTEMGAKGHEYIVNNFKWENIIVKFRNVFENVTKR